MPKGKGYGRQNRQETMQQQGGKGNLAGQGRKRTPPTPEVKGRTYMAGYRSKRVPSS